MCDNWKRVCELEKVHHCRLWKIYQLSVVRFPHWLELVRICKLDEEDTTPIQPTLSLPTGTIWRLALREALQRHRLLEGWPDGVPGVPGSTRYQVAKYQVSGTRYQVSVGAAGIQRSRLSQSDSYLWLWICSSVKEWYKIMRTTLYTMHYNNFNSFRPNIRKRGFLVNVKLLHLGGHIVSSYILVP